MASRKAHQLEKLWQHSDVFFAFYEKAFVRMDKTNENHGILGNDQRDGMLILNQHMKSTEYTRTEGSKSEPSQVGEI